MPKPDLSKLAQITSNTTNESIEKDETKESYHDHLVKLEAELSEKDELHDLESTVLNLSDYLQAVKMVVQQTFDHKVWVKAEIRNLSTKGGHYYFELAEKNDKEQVVATCRGTLWRFKADRVLNKFAQITGTQLTRDLTVLLSVSASFHPQYGFSLNIEDIDPSYTLGDLARQYSAMVERLTGEGLINANRQIPAPFDIKNVIVIAPENAAGLGDFRAEADHLERYNACNFHYQSSTFQGNHAPMEIRHAVINGVNKFSKKHNQLPDLMVIIRGGGAVGDLAYLNDYELAALIAEQPIPVWVGIGHERDQVILDEVAHTSFDTPSKVISGIINHLRQIVNNTQDSFDSIERYSKVQLQSSQSNNEKLLIQVQTNAASQIINQKNNIDFCMQNIKQNTKLRLQQSKIDVENKLYNIKNQAFGQIKESNQQSDSIYKSIKHIAKQQLVQAEKDCNYFREITLIQHPNRILKQGYSIVTDSSTGKVLTSASQLHPLQTITMTLKDGAAQATIHQINVEPVTA